MKSYGHILSAVASEIWALQPEKLRAMIGFLDLKSRGGAADPDVLARIQADAVHASTRAQNVSASSGGAVAVLPLYGMIMQRGNMMGDISGPRGTSLEQFTASFRQAVNDPAVSAIVLDIDSPGGTVSGVPELANEILSARKSSGKKIIAVSNSLCASAAYWIASACTEIVVSPSSLTGSIGVYSAHEDVSKALEQEGVSVTLITYGAHKVDGTSFSPLSDGARAEMQAMVDYVGQMFDKAVAKGRRVKPEDVAAKFGQGKVFNAQKAVSSGMADSIGTLDGVLARFGVSRSPSGQAGASSRMTGSDFGSGIQAAAVADGGDGACACDCGPCGDGECENCTVDGCDAAGCTCARSSARRSKAMAHAAHAHRERAIAIALLM
jgi:signal peptide peptidase SppA